MLAGLGPVTDLDSLPSLKHTLTALHPGTSPLVPIKRLDAGKDLRHLAGIKTIERIPLGFNPLGDGLLEFRPGSARRDLGCSRKGGQ